MNIDVIDQEAFNNLYNNRLFNVPNINSEEEETAFAAQFLRVTNTVEGILQERFSPDQYYLHPYYNRSRFIEVAFETDEFIDRNLIEEIQSTLLVDMQPWMLCMSFTCYLFISPDSVQFFAYENILPEALL